MAAQPAPPAHPAPPPAPPANQFSSPPAAPPEPAARRAEGAKVEYRNLFERLEALATRIGHTLGADDLAALNACVTEARGMTGWPADPARRSPADHPADPAKH